MHPHIVCDKQHLEQDVRFFGKLRVRNATSVEPTVVDIHTHRRTSPHIRALTPNTLSDVCSAKMADGVVTIAAAAAPVSAFTHRSPPRNS